MAYYLAAAEASPLTTPIDGLVDALLEVARAPQGIVPSAARDVAGADGLDTAARLFQEGVALLSERRLADADSRFRLCALEGGSDAAVAAALRVIETLLVVEPLPYVIDPELGPLIVSRSGDCLSIRRPDAAPCGLFLLAYIRDSILLPEEHRIFTGHSNFWESREIARLLLCRGFAVDAVDLTDRWPDDGARYDAVLSLHDALLRHGSRLPSHAVKIMLLTGRSPDHQNASERARAADLLTRRGRPYRLRRQIDNVAGELESLRRADACVFLGNADGLSTFEPSVQRKTSLVPVTASLLPSRLRLEDGPPCGKGFLWFFGSGALLKGLDLAIEVFLRNPSWYLEIVGDAAFEPDILAVYGDLIARSPNIRAHGFLPSASDAFADVLGRCFAFVAPSASESTSSSVVTCLQLGLLPILSRSCGVDLPPDLGHVLATCTIVEIEAAVAATLALGVEERRRRAVAVRELARRKYSREAFSSAMGTALDRSLARSRVGGGAPMALGAPVGPPSGRSCWSRNADESR